MSFEKPEIGYKWEILIGKRKRKRENGKRENSVPYEPQSTWISIFLDFGDYKVLDFLQMTLQSYRIIQVGDYKDFLKILVQILCGLR